MYSSVYPHAVDALKAAHQQDPNPEPDGSPAELLYCQRLADCLSKVYPDASEALSIAAWCQHLYRWEIARSTYPEGRVGYVITSYSIHYTKLYDKVNSLFILSDLFELCNSIHQKYVLENMKNMGYAWIKQSFKHGKTDLVI